MEPCKQERTIGSIEATLGSIQYALEKHSERDERLIEVLQTVAGQGELLKAHTESIASHNKALNELFDRNRVQDQEKTESEIKKPLAIRVWESRYGVYILGMILVGAIIDCLKNADLLRKLVIIPFGG